MSFVPVSRERDNRDIDTGRVIDEVRLRKCLWDATDQLYKSKDARTMAWSDIVVALFGNVPRHEKATLDKLIQQRWKTARDAYFRSKTRIKNTSSGSGAKKYKKYLFYDELSFLDHIEVNIVKEPTAERTYSTDNSSQDENENTPNTADTMFLKNTQPDGFDTQEREEKVNVTDAETRRTRTKKRKYTQQSSQEDSQFEKELLALVNKQTPDINSDDLAFFTSLGPVLKSFDIYQKLEFRSKVLSVAKDILFKTCKQD